LAPSAKPSKSIPPLPPRNHGLLDRQHRHAATNRRHADQRPQLSGPVTTRTRVSLNRQNDPNGDNATPILGERGGNALFLIDGLPNRDNFNGGPSAQFNQDSILEFQVVTSGYKAEFGHASGGIINVVTVSGNDWHGRRRTVISSQLRVDRNVPAATTVTTLMMPPEAWPNSAL